MASLDFIRRGSWRLRSLILVMLRDRSLVADFDQGGVMSKSKGMVLVIAVLGLLLSVCDAMALGSAGKGPSRMTVEQLKGMLGSPELIIVDVRDPISWSKSDTKIVGALREDPDKVSAWSGEIPKNKTIVFYCA